MEAPDRVLRRKTKQLKRCSWITCILVLLVIVVPVAVVFSRRNRLYGLASTVLVPLYIYPNSGAWDPLYEVLVAHPQLNFTVIINPEDGPGPSRYPNGDYTSQIQRLNDYSNVQTVGYVLTRYGTRNITSVLQDVATYSGWSTFNSTALAVSGIFFDEIPSKYSSANAQYLESIDQAVKAAPGLQRNRMVIHNPGAVPDTRFNDSSTDVTVVFEGSYVDFQLQQAPLALLSDDRLHQGYILHSVPANTSLANLVNPASKSAEFLFLTSLTQNYYESFGPEWTNFIDVVPT